MHQGIEALVLVLSTLFAHVHSYGQGWEIIEQNQIIALLDLYKNNGGGNWSEGQSRNWLNPGFVAGAPYNHPCNESDLFHYYHGLQEGGNDDDLSVLYPDEGYWTGVECTLNFTSKSFTLDALKFQDVNATGSVPTQLGYLTDLTTMNFRANQFSSQMPTELGALSKFRTRLSLDNNKISGTIPTQLGSWHRTFEKKLNLNHNNKISGTIPTQLGSLTGCETQFRLTSNRLTGKIPTQLGKMSIINSEFRADVNSLTGSIPTQFGHMNKMKFKFHLDRNSLSGCIPTQMGNIYSENTGNKVYGLDLSTNQLSCSIPTQVGQLTSLSSGLLFGSNSLTGPLPTEIGLLTVLTQSQGLLGLDVYGNGITGTLPTELGLLTNGIGFLDLRNNEVCGRIPSEVFGLLPFNLSDVFDEDADGLTESFYDFGPAGNPIQLAMEYMTVNNTVGYWCGSAPSAEPTSMPTSLPSTSTPTGSPTASPTSSSTGSPTAIPTALCIDRPDWNRAQEKDLGYAWVKNCSWVREWPNNRCDRLGEDGTYSYTACAKTCAGIHESSPCSPTAAPTEEGICSNSDTWLKSDDKPNKDCKWVGRRPNKRCKTLGNEGYASAECPLACGTCLCADDSNWRVTGKPNRGCDWVAGFTKNRCRKIGTGELDGFSACPVTCLSC